MTYKAFDFPERPDPTPEEACKLSEEFDYMVMALARRWNKTPQEVLDIVGVTGRKGIQ